MDSFITSSWEQLFTLKTLHRYMADHRGFIAGGCFKNLFNNEKIKDIDVFFESIHDFNEAVQHYTRKEDYVHVYENRKVIAFKDTKSGIKIELIRSVFGKPLDIIKTFDFSITKFAYYKNTEGDSISYTAVYHDRFFEHLHTKKLVINKDIAFPISTFERSLRYTKYGYGLCKESKQNLITSIRNTSEIDDLSKSLYEGLD